MKRPKLIAPKGMDICHNWVEVECENGGFILLTAEEYENGQLKRKIGKAFIRGDTIILITPAQ